MRTVRAITILLKQISSEACEVETCNKIDECSIEEIEHIAQCLFEKANMARHERNRIEYDLDNSPNGHKE